MSSVVATKLGGTAGTVAPGGNETTAFRGATLAAIGKLLGHFEELAKQAQDTGEKGFEATLVASLAGRYDESKKTLELTDSMARNFKEAGITKVGGVDVKPGVAISLEALINDHLASKKLPSVKLTLNAGNDSTMVLRAAEAQGKIQGPAQLGIFSTGSNVSSGGENHEAGHLSLRTALAKGGAPQVNVDDLIVGPEISLSKPSATASTLGTSGGKPYHYMNTIEMNLAGGRANTPLNLTDRATPDIHRGVKVYAVNAMKHILEGGDEGKLVLERLQVSEADVKNSPLMSLAQGAGVDSKDVTTQALAGDKFALAISKYAAQKMAGAMVGVSRLEGKEPPANVVLQGTYVEHLVKPEPVLEAFKAEYKNRTGITPNVQIFNPKDDGVLELAKHLGEMAKLPVAGS